MAALAMVMLDEEHGRRVEIFTAIETR